VLDGTKTACYTIQEVITMFKEVLFLSLAEMKLFAPSTDVVVISILAVSEEFGRPKLEGFRDVLRLQFEDTYEEGNTHYPGPWPDHPTEAENARYVQMPGERVCTLTDAQAIVDFLALHHSSFEQFTLLVHCQGGISRSAAVASWASVRYWVPMTGHRTAEYPNMRLMRLLDKAAGRR
jgi:predicted protein tyrosine phosphatase